MNNTRIFVSATIFLLFNLLMVGFVFVPNISFGFIDPQKFEEIEIRGRVHSIKWSDNGLYTINWKTYNSWTLDAYSDNGELQYTSEFLDQVNNSRPRIIDVKDGRVYINALSKLWYKGDEFYKIIQNDELFTQIIGIKSPGLLVEEIKIPFHQFDVLFQASLNYNSTKAKNENFVIENRNAVIHGDNLLFFQSITHSNRSDYNYYRILKAYNFQTQNIVTLGYDVFNYRDFFWSVKQDSDKTYLIGTRESLDYRQMDIKIYEITKNLDLVLLVEVQSPTINNFIQSDKIILSYNKSRAQTNQGYYLTIINLIDETKYTNFIPYSFSFDNFNAFDNHILITGYRYFDDIRSNLPLFIDLRKQGRVFKLLELHNYLPEHFNNGEVYQIVHNGRKVAIVGMYNNKSGGLQHSIFMNKKAYTPALFSLRFSPLFQFNFYGLIITSIYLSKKRFKRQKLPDILDYPKK